MARPFRGPTFDGILAHFVLDEMSSHTGSGSPDAEDLDSFVEDLLGDMVSLYKRENASVP